jgi:RNA polymerase sigma factor (sigma-70 family)
VQDADFERLVRRHAQDVYAFLLYRIGDHHIAEEVLADTLERPYLPGPRYDRRRASEKTWLIGIALNRWRDLVRRSASERAALAALSERAEPEHSMDDVDERRSLLRALAALPDDERDVVTLAYGADLTAKQVATVLDLPLTTVHGRLYRGLKRLRGTLD